MIPNTKVFVGSLPPGAKPEELRRLFEKYGSVTECDIMNRCGFVHMQNADMATSAIQALNKTNFKGATICVEPGRMKERGSGGGGSGGGGGGSGGSRGGPGGRRGPPGGGGSGDRRDGGRSGGNMGGGRSGGGGGGPMRREMSRQFRGGNPYGRGDDRGGDRMGFDREFGGGGGSGYGKSFGSDYFSRGGPSISNSFGSGLAALGFGGGGGGYSSGGNYGSSNNYSSNGFGGSSMDRHFGSSASGSGYFSSGSRGGGGGGGSNFDFNGGMIDGGGSRNQDRRGFELPDRSMYDGPGSGSNSSWSNQRNDRMGSGGNIRSMGGSSFNSSLGPRDNYGPQSYNQNYPPLGGSSSLGMSRNIPRQNMMQNRRY